MSVRGDLAARIAVYITPAASIPTRRMPACYSHDTRDLVQAALAGLESIYRGGYRYHEVGVVLMKFVSIRQI